MKIICFIGDWSDRDPKWSQVAESVKRSMGQNRLDDGEFWMEFFSDFCREFEEVSICTLGPDFNHDGIVDTSQVKKYLKSKHLERMVKNNTHSTFSVTKNAFNIYRFLECQSDFRRLGCEFG